MQHPVAPPTPEALADLAARCAELARYETQMVVAEEARVAALAAALVSMRTILELEPIPADRLPARQARAEHWALSGPTLAAARTAEIERVPGQLALDGHGQIKILGGRSWRGHWRAVTLWRDGILGLRSSALMDYLARLAALANERAPAAAHALIARRGAVASADALLGALGSNGARGG